MARGRVAILVSLGWGLWRGGAHRVVALFAGSTLAYNLWVGGDWPTGLPSRFAIPAMPALFCLVLVGLWRTKWLRDGGQVARCGVMLAGVSIGSLASSERARSDWYGIGNETAFKSQNVALLRAGHYLREHSAESASVALHWAGTTAYFAERPAVDVLGKSDRHIARLVVDEFSPGHSKWDWSYVVHALRPDVVLDVSRGLEDRPDFRSSYLLATTDVGGESLQFFVRRGAEGKIRDAGVAFWWLLGSGRPPAPVQQALPELVQPRRTRGKARIRSTPPAAVGVWEACAGHRRAARDRARGRESIAPRQPGAPGCAPSRGAREPTGSASVIRGRDRRLAVVAV